MGINKAAAITYRAEQVYLFPESNYSDARFFTIRAARDLYGANAAEVITTAAAWDAVGVFDFTTLPDSLVASFDSSFGVHLNWVFNGAPVTGFAIEKAFDSSSNFLPIATVSGSVRHFKDLNFDSTRINKYRIRAFTGNPATFSVYSPVAQISLPTAPYFVSQNGTFTTCGTIITDRVGLEITQMGSTFIPP